MGNGRDQEHAAKILSFLNRTDYKPMRAGDLAFLMEIPGKERHIFDAIIDDLVKSGRIVLTKKSKLVPPRMLNMLTGTFSARSGGYGFVTVSEADSHGGADIFIPPPAAGDAAHGDLVLCRITAPADGERSAEGEVVRVLKTGVRRLVGTLGADGMAAPEDKRYIHSVFIPKGERRGALAGDVVVVRIKVPYKNGQSPKGEIVEIIGRKDAPGMNVTAIVRDYDIPVEFPESALREAGNIPQKAGDAEISDPMRVDLRARLIVTIDNDDTKDMDDAVSLDTDADGNYVLGVHIADVSHYVRPGSALDAEALLRGTSVYLADRVIPMLPQALSNGICSLNENEDRLTVSCVMTIDRAGKVVSHEIFPSVIKVAKRLTYSAANAMLAGESLESDGNNEVNRADNTAICGLLTRLAALSETLLQKRLSRGAVVLDIPETKVTVDGDGAPVDIGPYQHGPASGIIEECMLACNETVAEEYSRLGLTFAYRCHEEPDAENMTRLKLFAKSFGYDLKLHAFREREGRADKKHGPRKKKPQSLSKALQGLLSQIAGTPEEAVIGKAILRSFKQARYHPENLGHFGLAARYYCHFTSPIRRYPDLIVHRVINEHLRGMSAPEQDRLEKSMPSVCGRSSSAERRAEELEREVDNLKKAQYMSKRIGQVYDGIISGVSGRGLYVALPNTVEGSVSMRDLYGDYFIFDERRMALVGERFGKVYRPGQTVRVKVTGADPESRSVSFKIE